MHKRTPDGVHRRLSRTVVLVFVLVAPTVWGQVRVIRATGEYRMGDNDTRSDAKRLALQDAKRRALEQAGTYLESVTEVQNLQLSRDDLRTYSAGMVEVIEDATRTAMQGDTMVIRVDVTVRVDPTLVARQIETLRQNPGANAELRQLREEMEKLRQRVHAQTQEMAALRSSPEVRTVMEQRRQTLTQAEVNDLLTQAWVALVGSEDTLSVGTSSVEGRKRARRLTEQALALDLSNASAHVRMGEVLTEEGDYEAAERAFRDALRLKPDYAEAHKNLGVVIFIKGDLRGAIERYQQALRLQPDDPESHLNLGLALLFAGDPNGAIAAHREALRLKPDYAQAHSSLGLAFQATGDLDAALVEFRQAYHRSSFLRCAIEPNCYCAHSAISLANPVASKARSTEAQCFKYILRLSSRPAPGYIAFQTLPLS